MSICSVLPGLSLGMGDLRPFSPLAGFFRYYVTLPHFCPRFLPGSANFLRFSAPAREVSGFVRIKKIKIFSPRRRAAQPFAPPVQKSSHSCRKSRYALCITAFSLFFPKCFLVFFHAQILQRPVSCIIFRHEFPASLLHNL